MTRINDIGKEIKKQLQYYANDVAEKVEDAQDETTKRLVKDLKQDSPKNRPSYAKGWRIKKVKNAKVVHNKTDYQLTHLLEKGHAKRNGEREPAQVHIRPNEERAVKDYLKKIEGAIKE
jgi:hypothetical protein